MNADLDAFATELYVTVDDILITHPDLMPSRPLVGIKPLLTDAELVTLAVLQALLGYHCEARFIRYAHSHLTGLFPYLPNRPAYNKRLRQSTTMLQGVLHLLASHCAAWHDNVWLIDSTPVECGRSRETAKRSNLAGIAGYGYCASHSRHFWGLRLHLIATPAGLPIAYALTNPKDDERSVARNLLETDPDLLARCSGQTIMADKGYRSADLETLLNDHGATLIRPAFRTEANRPGHRYLTVPTDHRIDQPDPQSPTRPRTTRRPQPRRGRRPRPPATPRPHRRHLAQRTRRHPTPPLPHRLRPLTSPWN